MTNRTFEILDYCATWVDSCCWAIFQNRWLGMVYTFVPESENRLYKGMWLYVSAQSDIVFRATGEIADNVIKISDSRYLYLYRLE